MEQSIKRPATIFVLDLDAGQNALRIAHQIATKMGREIDVRDSDGNLIGAVKPTRH